MTTLQVIILAALVVAVLLGFATRINAGLFALFFSYIIGTFMMGIRPSQVVALWPTRIFFILFSVTYFYNFATENETLEKTAGIILYKFRRFPAALPYVIFLVAFIISILGAGYYSVVALLCPLGLTICKKSKLDPLLGAMAVLNGAVSGGQMFTTASGAVVREIIAAAGYQEQSTMYAFLVFVTTTVGCLFIFSACYFILKGYKVKAENLDLQKPEPFTSIQRKTIALILTMLTLVIVPVILQIFMPDVLIIRALAGYMDIGFVSIALAIAATLMKLGDARSCMKAVPWNTIVLISGVGILIALATEAGLVETLGAAVAGAGHPLAVGLLISTAAGIMSIFSSTIGVVLPTLYPIVGGLAAATGLSPIYLMVIINTGSVSTGVSPFSSGGGLVLGSCTDEDTQKLLYPRLVACTGIFLIINVVWSVLYYFIF